MKQVHVQSYFEWIASGGTHRDSDFKDPEGLRIDLGSMPAVEAVKVREITRQAARDIREARESGHNGRAREIARETAHQVASLIGDRYTPEPAADWPSDPREAAARIRRH